MLQPPSGEGGEVPENPGQFAMTFRICTSTNLGGLKDEACDFWGVIKSEYGLFDEHDNDVTLNIEPHLLEAGAHFENASSSRGGGGSNQALLYLKPRNADQKLEQARVHLDHKEVLNYSNKPGAKRKEEAKQEEEKKESKDGPQEETLEEQFLEKFVGLRVSELSSNPLGPVSLNAEAGETRQGAPLGVEYPLLHSLRVGAIVHNNSALCGAAPRRHAELLDEQRSQRLPDDFV